MRLLARPAEQFQPFATYDPDGDCVEFLAKPDPFYAERVDDLVTVYYSQETGEVMGSLIKGLSSLCDDFLQRMPGFRIVIQHARIRLEHIFLARLWALPGDTADMATRTYQKLVDIAGTTGVEIDAELCPSLN